MFALYIAEKKFQRHSGYQRTTVLHFRQLVWRIRVGKHLLTVFGKVKSSHSCSSSSCTSSNRKLTALNQESSERTSKPRKLVVIPKILDLAVLRSE